MDKYTIIEGKKGLRYQKNGKFIATAKVSKKIIEELKTKTSVEEIEQQAPRVCIFCGQGSNLTRFVNMQTVVLCEEHYYSTNIGQIAQKLKENESG